MNKQAQTKLHLNAEANWFHVFRSMIDGGDAAKMGGTAFLVYAVVKSFVNWGTGKAFPKLSLIAEKAGISVDQVKRCLKSLEEMGYLTKEKQGRCNIYTLREKVQINDEEGRPAAVATWDYLPSTVKAAQAELKNFLMSGDLAGSKIVHIENLNLNIQVNYASGNKQHIETILDRIERIQDPRIREFARQLHKLPPEEK